MTRDKTNDSLEISDALKATIKGFFGSGLVLAHFLGKILDDHGHVGVRDGDTLHVFGRCTWMLNQHPRVAIRPKHVAVGSALTLEIAVV